MTKKNYNFSETVNGTSFNPIALRKAKIVYNFGLSKCNRVKGNDLSPIERKLFPFRLAPFKQGGSYCHVRLTSLEETISSSSSDF